MGIRELANPERAGLGAFRLGWQAEAHLAIS
jgi:hypothetical protein